MTTLRAHTAPLVAFLAALPASIGCGHHDDPAPVRLTRDQLLDPLTCQGCHPTQYADWTRSMHAYASDDPVFAAMNQRGQRETAGRLGDFCVKCHAPMALHDGQTTDGLDLPAVPHKYKGVTCFFCHAIDAIQGTHNAALGLSDDLQMRGEYRDPLANDAHASVYSDLHDLDQKGSAPLCGTCHDIVVDGTNAPIERTFCEWSLSAFSAPPAQGGQTCAQCHMTGTRGVIAQVDQAKVREVHAHDFPAVDVRLGAGIADQDVERAGVQRFLASSLQGALCVTQAAGVRVILDPVFLGHDWPSGATQDRRAWAEVVAYKAGAVIYQSGVVPDGTSVVDLQGSDPGLWLLRDQMYDDAGSPVSMFWQAASSRGNEIPALATFDALDPRFYQTHVERLYPGQDLALPDMPDRVTFRLRLQPIGRDVLEDLVDSGDLDGGVVDQMPTWDVSFLSADGGVEAGFEWTPEAAATTTYRDEFDHTLASCVATFGFNVGANKVLAPAPALQKGCADGTDDGGLDGGRP